MRYRMIACGSGQFGLEGDGIHIEDIFVSRQEMIGFVGRLNRFDVSTCHIYDVIEDYFGELV